MEVNKNICVEIFENLMKNNKKQNKKLFKLQIFDKLLRTYFSKAVCYTILGLPIINGPKIIKKRRHASDASIMLKNIISNFLLLRNLKKSFNKFTKLLYIDFKKLSNSIFLIVDFDNSITDLFQNKLPYHQQGINKEVLEDYIGGKVIYLMLLIFS